MDRFVLRRDGVTYTPSSRSQPATLWPPENRDKGEGVWRLRPFHGEGHLPSPPVVGRDWLRR